jgi:hypothetical protein
MAKITYQPGIPRILPKWEAYLSGLADKAGLSTLTISSAYRTPEKTASSMYDNALNRGIVNAMQLYAAPGKQVLSVMQTMIRRKAGPGDTISAMAAKMREIGPGSVSKHTIPPSDKFVVVDVPPGSIPENRRADFEKVFSGAASKFLSPFKFKGEPVYHMEFGGVKIQTVAAGGSAVTLIIAAIAWYIISKGKLL